MILIILIIYRCTASNMDTTKGGREFLVEIGRTVAKLCSHIPSGVLVFLSSYALLRQAGSVWRETGVRTIELCLMVRVESVRYCRTITIIITCTKSALQQPV